jgi:phosphatidylserine decarboxylase
MLTRETLKTLPQYMLPHHALSQLMSKFTHSKNKCWKNLMIRQIIKHYGVNMSEALQQDINAFASFNDFFTRELQPAARPLTREPNAIASPADGVVSQAGAITAGEIFQAKGKTFNVVDLLGGDVQRAAPFQNGVFSTIYLSPKDYHRLHIPLTGTLKEMLHVPGRLFSVNGATTNSVPRLFARNERVVAIFDTEVGEMALVLVGAIFVSSIETVWHGVVTPPTRKTVRHWRYDENAPRLAMGEEMGRFNMGSTIIVLFANNAVQWLHDVQAGKEVKVGERIGQYAMPATQKPAGFFQRLFS